MITIDATTDMDGKTYYCSVEYSGSNVGAEGPLQSEITTLVIESKCILHILQTSTSPSHENMK